MENNEDVSEKELLSSVSSYNDEMDKVTEEDRRFGSKSPFITLMQLSLGPLLSRLSSTFQDAIDLFIIKKRFGTYGSGVVALSAMVRNMTIAFSIFMSYALMVQVSSLVGQKKTSDAAQLLVDSLRIAIIVGIIFPIIIYFSNIPILKFLECPDEYLKDSSKYVFSASTLTIFASIFQTFCGVLLGLGKSTLTGIIQIGSIAFSLFIADPIFCFATHTPLWSLGFAFVSGQAVFAIILFVLFFMGKFTIKPTMGMFISKNSEFLGTTVGKSVQYIISILSGVIPPFCMLKFLISAAKLGGIPTTSASQIFTTFIHPFNIIATVAMGFLAGLPSAAAYAFNAKLYKRVFQLLYKSLIVPMLIMAVLIPIVIAIPDKIQSIWIDDTEVLQYSKYIRPPFYTLILLPTVEALNGLLILSGHSVLGALPNAIVFISRLAAVFILHYTNKSNPWVIFYAMPISDICGFITAIVGSIVPIKFMNKELKDAESTEKSQLNESLLLN